jgi:predicted porin
MIQAGQRLGMAACIAVGLAASSHTALAQSTTNVTLYGIVDTGVEYIDGVNVGGRKESLARVNANNQVASRWGLRGTEDLGGGLKAVFNLENGFAGDTGSMLQSGRLFGRAAVVGLEGDWGGVLFGRQRNTIFDLALVYDPMPYATYSITAHDNAFFTQRPDNSIKYSKKMGALSGSLLYSFGRDSLAGGGSQSEVAGNSKIGRQVGANLNYASGPFSVGFGFDQQQGTSAATDSEADRRYFLAGTYTLSTTKMYAGMLRRKNDIPAVDTTSNLYWVGVQQPLTAKLGLSVSLSRASLKDSPNKALLLGTSLHYDFSKRTQVYLNVGYSNNDGASTQGVTANTAATPGGSQRGIASGIVHRF